MAGGGGGHSLYDHFRVDPETDGEGHEGLIFNPRLLGGNIPFRSNGYGPSGPPLKNEELEELDTRPVGKVELFDLSDPAQKARYETVFHRICGGWYVKIHVERHWDDARKCMMVYLEWCEMSKEVPAHLDRIISGSEPSPAEEPLLNRGLRYS